MLKMAGRRVCSPRSTPLIRCAGEAWVVAAAEQALLRHFGDVPEVAVHLAFARAVQAPAEQLGAFAELARQPSGGAMLIDGRDPEDFARYRGER